MANPMGALKRVPKWAWLTSGGVVVGVLVMKRMKGGSSGDSDTQGEYAGGDAETSPTTYGFSSFPSAGVATGDGGGYVVGSDTGASASDVLSLIPSLIPTYEPPDMSAVWQAFKDMNDRNAQAQADAAAANQAAIQAIMAGSGGGAPTSDPSSYTPPPANSTPARAPAKKCPAKYPFQSDRGCYQVVCQKKAGTKLKSPGRWHAYENGTYVHVSSTPC